MVVFIYHYTYVFLQNQFWFFYSQIQLTERQLEIIYSYAQFVSSQQSDCKSINDDELNDVLDNVVGFLPDTGKSLEDYRAERMAERYEFAN